MGEWSESVKIAMDVIIACVIIVAMLVVGQLAKQIMTTMDNEQSTSASVREYRVQRLYDNRQCYASDIINLVLEYQGEPAVTVQHTGASVLKWDKNGMASDLTSEAISNKLKTALYRCSLEYDTNGTLRAFNFTEV